MLPKFFFPLLQFFIIFNIIYKGESAQNPGRKLQCWPSVLYYGEFRVDFKLSLRGKAQQILDPFRKDQIFKPENYGFDPRRKTAVIVHGMGGSSNEINVKNAVTELLRWEDMNVISVDWAEGCSNPLQYQIGAANTEFVAKKINKFFGRLIKVWENTDKSVDQWGPIHFIGMSLGAHVVGQAADLLKRKKNLTIDRITGLDPAEPCFENADSPLRLKSDHANFVDIIHTDGASTINESYGILKPMGHVDFYVNGGSVQPGCNQRRKRDLHFDKLLIHALGNGGCHHQRSFVLFNQSIRNILSKKCTFWARPWNLGTSAKETNLILKQKCTAESCIEMGINAGLYNKARGTYYVATTGGSPFCQA